MTTCACLLQLAYVKVEFNQMSAVNLRRETAMAPYIPKRYRLDLSGLVFFGVILGVWVAVGWPSNAQAGELLFSRSGSYGSLPYETYGCSPSAREFGSWKCKKTLTVPAPSGRYDNPARVFFFWCFDGTSSKPKHVQHDSCQSTQYGNQVERSIHCASAERVQFNVNVTVMCGK